MIIKIATFLLVFSVFISACKKDVQSTTPTPGGGGIVSDTVYLGIDSLNNDDLSDEEYEVFQQIEDTVSYPLDSLVLSDGNYINASSSPIGGKAVNGISISKVLGGAIARANISKLGIFFKAMIKQANFLSGPMNFAENDIKPNGPAQTKIAYVIGPQIIKVKGKVQYLPEGKDYTIRSKTPACTDFLHGLDCSGYLDYIFRAGGAKFPPFDPDDNGAEAERKPANISTAIASSVGASNLFEVKDFGNSLTKENMKAGDIMYFLVDGAKITHHIGVIGQAGKSATSFLYHSFGNGHSCDRNKSSAGGPIAWSFNKLKPSEIITLKDSKGKNHTVSFNIVRIRYVAELESISSPIAIGSANSISVKVYSSDSLPVNNISVNFTSSDGSLNQDVLPVGGVATVSWTPGANSNTQTCTATIKSPIDNSTILDQVVFTASNSNNSFYIQTVNGDNGTYNIADHDDNFDWNYIYGPMPLTVNLHIDGSTVSGNFIPAQQLTANGQPFSLNGSLNNDILNLTEHHIEYFIADDYNTNPDYGEWKVETFWNFNGTFVNGYYSGTFSVVQTESTDRGPQRPDETITSTGIFNVTPMLY